MTEKDKLFRKVSLERLSSPEELDQVIQVTTPKGWIALLTLAGLIIVGMIWGIFGSVPTKVSGMGIFISGEGVKDISAPTWGQVTTVYISPGEIVARGQMVARIAQPELITEISRMRSKLMEFEREKSQIRTYIQSETGLQAQHSDREKTRISSEIINLREQIDNLGERRENQKILLEKGLITRQQYLATQVEIKSLEQKISQLSNQKKQIPLSLLHLQEDHEQRIRNKCKGIKHSYQFS
jgi:HlyD family secretion protein